MPTSCVPEVLQHPCVPSAGALSGTSAVLISRIPSMLHVDLHSYIWHSLLRSIAVLPQIAADMHVRSLSAACLVKNACCSLRCHEGVQLATLFGLSQSRGLDTHASSFSCCLPSSFRTAGVSLQEKHRIQLTDQPELCLISQPAPRTDLLATAQPLVTSFGSHPCLPEAPLPLLPEL